MGKKILLADDSITIQKVIELTFSDEDFEVVTVGNGRLAIERVQEVRPDVVLCDVIMPEKDGYEVCDFIKKSAPLAHIPVLLLTGAFEPFDQERAARVGCDGFLAKPFEPETLIARVKDLLGKASRPAAPVVASPAPRPAVAPPPAPEAMAPPPPQAPPTLPPFAPAAAPSPFAASMPVASPMAEEAEVSFIPDEPFEDLDSPDLSRAVAEASAALPSAPMVEDPGMEEPVEELMPLSAEETDSLSGGGDDSSTVMFRADALPWSTAPRAAAPPPPAPAEEGPAEVSVLEEVIEADAFETSDTLASLTGPGTMPSAPAPPIAQAPPSAPTPPPPPNPPPMRRAASFELPPRPAASFEPPPRPVAAFEPPARPVASFDPLPPPPAPAPPPLAEPAFQAFRPPAAAPAPPPPAPTPVPPPAPPAPAAEPAMAASSFADVAASISDPEVEGVKASVAAQVDVPVDMVSQIAQRVVAQVSEKVVERIAWEVIPELAEALIKREIERLKAELQQLG